LVLLSEILERRIRRSTNNFVSALTFHHQHLPPGERDHDGSFIPHDVDLALDFDDEFRCASKV
jgi:hypothetical protein